MAFHITDGRIGWHDPGDKTSTLGPIPLGSIVRAVDPTLGEGEFIYLLGVSSTVPGSCVTYNATTWQTALSPTDATGNGSPVAVAMSANLGSSYDWYQISGLATVKKTAVAVSPQVALFVSGTAGRVYTTDSAGKQILGFRAANLATVASGTSTVTVLMDRPHLER